MRAPEEHTGSYYAATANEKTSYPTLEGQQSVDICVIGGGFTGVATTLELIERGFKVALIEANRISWGASGRNGGQLIAGISGETRMIENYKKKTGKDISDMMFTMSWRGNEIVRDRIKKHNIECDLKDGYIDVAKKQVHMDSFQEWYDYLKSYQLPHEIKIIQEDELPDLIGTTAYKGGILNYGNGHLHPLNLCIGEARAAHELGASIFEQSPVTHIEHGAKPKVHTSRGFVEADTVILTGNAYHRLEQKVLGGKQFPAATYMVATEPLGERAKEILPHDIAVCEASYILDYYRLSQDGRLLYGGRCDYSGREPSNIKEAIMPRMLKIYPELKDVRIDYEWGGKMGIVVKRVPLLGKSAPNVFYAQGYSGHGVNVSHLVGEIMADAVTGTMERFDVFNKVSHIPIPGGQWFGNQMVALGMLYYRLLDILPEGKKDRR